MKLTYRLLALCVLLSGFFFSGCSTVQLNSDVTPGVNLTVLKKFYVVHLVNDTRGIDKLVVERLKKMGYDASSGEESATPNDIDAVITYQDKWMWDMTMYMIELNVQVRKPVTNISLATGHSLRTSLARKSPPEMVQEVLTEVFKKR